MAHVFKLNGDYDCSVTDIENLEALCEQVVAEELTQTLKECLGREIDVKVSWIYDGYQVYIMEKLSEPDILEFVRSLDPVKQIGICKLYWDVNSSHTTGVLLAYDYTHYLRIIHEGYSFIILAKKGIDHFMEKLELKFAFLNPELEFKYVKDKEYERRVTGEKLKGCEFKAEVHIDPERTGKMYTGGGPGYQKPFRRLLEEKEWKVM